IPLRANIFCLWLLAHIPIWHRHGSSIPSSCTTSCAHHCRPQCATSVSGQTPLVTTPIKEEDWESSNKLSMLQIKCTGLITQNLCLLNTSKDEKRSKKKKKKPSLRQL
ncbi:hypothetical protein K5549_022097, partial [Capra hircus]